MTMALKIDLDFEELDKLPPEQYNQLESKFLKLFQEAITKAEEDYCKKKGTTKEEINKDYNKYKNMQNAINNRKEIKKFKNTCMKFNRMLRPYIKDKVEGLALSK